MIVLELVTTAEITDLKKVIWSNEYSAQFDALKMGTKEIEALQIYQSRTYLLLNHELHLAAARKIAKSAD